MRTPVASFNISVVQPSRGNECAPGDGAAACADASSADGSLVRAHLAFGVHVELAHAGERFSGMLGGMIGAVAKIGLPGRPGELSEDNYFVWVDNSADFRGAPDAAFAVADLRAAGPVVPVAAPVAIGAGAGLLGRPAGGLSLGGMFEAAAAALRCRGLGGCAGNPTGGNLAGSGAGRGGVTVSASGVINGSPIYMKMNVVEGVTKSGGRVQTMSGTLRYTQ